MKKPISISQFLEAFFREYLNGQLHASENTIASYSDTFQLILKYASKKLNKKASKLTFSEINAKFLCNFLDDQEERKKVCARTRNARLVAIRSFFHYLSYRLPELSGMINEVLAIPEKRMDQKQIDFLTNNEVNALLRIPDQKTWIGKRDYVFLLVAIQTGMRLSELTALKWKDVHLEQCAHIECVGKGRKNRLIPLSKETIQCLYRWKKELDSSPTNILFSTIHGDKMSSDAVQYMVRKYAEKAAIHCHTLNSKKVTPHVLRHTTAMRLLQAGVDLLSIALWLGHESIKTTYIYLRADIEMKETILKKLPCIGTKTSRYKPSDEIMVFLKNLSSLNKKNRRI